MYKKTFRTAALFSMLLGILCVLIPVSAAPVYAEGPPSAGSSVTNDVYNLALNKSVIIREPDAIFDQIQKIGYYDKETRDMSKASKLTDGKYGNLANWADVTDWFVFYRKMRREVIVDLEQINSVNSISIGFGQRADVGIGTPLNVRYYVSNDGVDYRYIGMAKPDVPNYFAYSNTSSDMDRKVFKLDKTPEGAPLNVQARYVKLVFVINIFGWADEIEIGGKEGIVDDAEIPPVRDDGMTFNQFVLPGTPEAAHIRNQFLWYSGPMKAGNERFSDWTKDKVLPIFGYQDIKGEIVDWQYDDILALPITSMVTPSGLDSNGNAKFATKHDFLAYLDFIFKSDTQLGAINAAVAEVNAKLNTNKKVRVNMAIPYLLDSEDFGDIGKGVPFSTKIDRTKYPNTREGQLQAATDAFNNRVDAIKWYVDEVIRRFNESGYSNLQLDSFYWYHERISDSYGENDLIYAIGDYIKSRNYFFTWIPYVGPGSFYQWRDLGFTTGSLQPGFAFGAATKELFNQVVQAAKNTGGSIEIEYDSMHSLAVYLNNGYFQGYMNSANTYYYGGSTPIIDSAYALTPTDNRFTDANSVNRRNVYDRIYEYVKGTYKPRFTAAVSSNVTNPDDIGVNIKLPLANSYTEGSLTIVYDDSLVTYKGFTLGASLKDKASVEVDTSSPGLARISFEVSNPANAVYADLIEKRNPMNGAPDLITLKFAKKPGVDAAAITARKFALDASGNMIDINGNEYLNFGASDMIPGSLEEQFARASDSVNSAVNDRALYGLASALVAALPDGRNKSVLQAKLAALDPNEVKVELVTPVTEFALGSDAVLTVRGSNQTGAPKQMTLIIAVYEKTANKMVNYSAVTQTIDAGKYVLATAMMKLPGSGEYEVRAFVWDSLTSMKPLSATIVIPVN